MLQKETNIYPVLCYKFGDIDGKKDLPLTVITTFMNII